MLHRTIYSISICAVQERAMKTLSKIWKSLFPSQEEILQRRFEEFMADCYDIRDVEYRMELWDRGGYGYNKNTFGGLNIR
jgi:hypothetical protein